MVQTLKIAIHSNGRLQIIGADQSGELGYELESGATKVRFILPTEEYGHHHFIECLTPMGDALSSQELTESTDATDNSHYIEVTVGSRLLNQPGCYYFQYVGKSTDTTPVLTKSGMIKLILNGAINAITSVSEAGADEVNYILNKLNQIEGTIGSAGEALSTANRALTTASNEVERATRREDGLQSQIDALVGNPTGIWLGVMFNGKETKGTHIGTCAGFRSGVNGGSNDFDRAPIFKDLQMITKSNGEKYVRIPKFFIRHWDNSAEGYTAGDAGWWEAFAISETKISNDWLCPIGFLNASKVEMNYFEIGAYKASLSGDGTHLLSKSGSIPKTLISLEDARPLGLANPNGAHLCELRKREVVEILYMIEFATRDTQNDGPFQGVTFALSLYPSDEASLNTSDTNDIIVSLASLGLTQEEVESKIKSNQHCFIVDENDNDSKLGEADRTITALTFITLGDEDCVKVTVNGSSFDATGEDGTYPCLKNFSDITGQTDGLSGSSRESPSSAYGQGTRHFCYRGIEDFFGVYTEWGDGRFIKHYLASGAQTAPIYDDIMECFNPANYDTCNVAKGTTGSDYVPTFSGCEKITTADIGNYPLSFKSLASYPGAFLPAVEGGDGASGYADYMGGYFLRRTYNQSAAYISAFAFCCGGDCYGESSGGPFCVRMSYSSIANSSYGFRLCVNPS